MDTSESLPGEGVAEEQQPCSDTPGDGITPPFGDHHYILADASSPSRLMADSVESLQHELARVKQEYDELSSRCVHLSAIKDNQVKFKHFTGLPNYGTFSALFCFLEPKASRLKVWRGQSTLREVCASGPVRRGSLPAHLRKVSLDDQFFVVLLRLRTAPSELQLAHCLGIYESTFSRIFITWINFLACELSGMHVFPTIHPPVMASSFQRFHILALLLIARRSLQSVPVDCRQGSNYSPPTNTTILRSFLSELVQVAPCYLCQRLGEDVPVTRRSPSNLACFRSFPVARM